MKRTIKISQMMRGALVVAVAFLATLSSRGADTGSRVSTDYKLQSGDIVRVQIFQEPDLDREVSVSMEGAIALPLIGRVDVKDKTLSKIEQLVRELYDRDYLVNPQVSIMVVKFQSRTVNVIGAVNAPQAVEFPPEQTLTLLDAISRAGGFNRFADRKKVRLTRSFGDGRQPENFIINADQLISGTASERWVLLKDDVIFVPESVL